MDLDGIGKFICELRTERGLTQRELAEKIGVTSKAISRWECGLGCPDISLLEPLSNELHVSILELLKGKRLLDNKRLENDDVDYLIKVIINTTNNKRKKLFSIIYSLIVFIILGLVTIIYFKNNFHGYINYLSELKRKIMLVPFNSLIVIFSGGINFLYRNILLFLKNFIINFLLGILVNSYILLFVKDKGKYIRVNFIISLFMELFKWMVLFGMFDIDDLLVRFVSGIVVYYLYKLIKKKKYYGKKIV